MPDGSASAKFNMAISIKTVLFAEILSIFNNFLINQQALRESRDLTFETI